MCKDSDFLKIYQKESVIKGSGNGLFAKQFVNQGELIVEFYGSVIPTSLSEKEPFIR